MPRVWLSLGSNIDREQNISSALSALNDQFGALSVSSVYESVAVGFSGDPFYNLIVGMDTDVAVESLAVMLRRIEADHGRVRDGGGFAPRTLDIDLLTYDDLVMDGALVLPRDEITRYAFVLKPLSEIAGDELHPVLGCSYVSLWQQSDLQDQELWPIEFDLSDYG